jgi:signal transduction histidine kinase
VDWFFHPDDYQNTVNILKHALETGEAYEVEFRLRRKDGVYRWFLGRAVAMKDNSGNVIKWFGTSTEIHDHKIALENLAGTKEDLQNVNEMLNAKNLKLTKTNMDLDNFIYTASHDLKAPVTNIEGLIGLLSSNLRNDNKEDIEDILKMIDNSIKRFQKTISELTDISKIQKDLQEDIVEIKVTQCIEEIKLDIQSLIIGSGAVIKMDTAQAPVVRFSKINFRSLIYNLLTNAIKYASPDRQPLVEVKTWKYGEYFLLEVKDNGLGIKEEYKDKIFSMFKRLHDHVEGTGVGLYIVKRIVENSGGKIEVESKLGEGSVFKIYLKRK